MNDEQFLSKLENRIARYQRFKDIFFCVTLVGALVFSLGLVPFDLIQSWFSDLKPMVQLSVGAAMLATLSAALPASNQI